MSKWQLFHAVLWLITAVINVAGGNYPAAFNAISAGFMACVAVYYRDEAKKNFPKEY